MISLKCEALWKAFSKVKEIFTIDLTFFVSLGDKVDYIYLLRVQIFMKTNRARYKSYIIYPAVQILLA